MDTGHIIGFVAAALSCVASIPHLVKSLKTGTQGISSTAWWLASMNSLLWITFAVMTHTYATLISSIANGLVAFSILFLVYAERRVMMQQQQIEDYTETYEVEELPPMRIPVSVQMRRLETQKRDTERVFTEITRTLEMPVTRDHRTGELIPA